MLIPRESRVAFLIVGVIGLIGALAFALAWYWAMDRGYSSRFETWLYDWNVYHAAAQDLLDRSLYKTPLSSAWPEASGRGLQLSAAGGL